MEMFYLIVKLNYASVVIPEKYTKEQCDIISKPLKANNNTDAYCILAPAGNYCKFHLINRMEVKNNIQWAVTEKVCD